MRDKITFLVVGFTATALYSLGTSALARATGWAPFAAGILVYLAIIPAAYLGQKMLTFRADTRHRDSFPRYAGLQLSGLALTTLANALVVGRTSADPFFLFLIAAAAAALNYLFMRHWVFRSRADAPHAG